MDLLKSFTHSDSTPKHDDHKPSPNPEHHERSLFDKIGSAIGGDHHVSQPPPPPQPVKQEGLLGKINDAFGDHKSTPSSNHPSPPKDESLIDKISKIGGDHHEAPRPASPPKHEGLLGKLSHVVSPQPPPPQKQENLLGKLGSLVGHEEPKRPETLSDKIQGVFGGGSVGEQKEDTLDKAIDLVQEHVFKQGDQSRESAMEQAKDHQIAEVLRKTLHIGDKK